MPKKSNENAERGEVLVLEKFVSILDYVHDHISADARDVGDALNLSRTTTYRLVRSMAKLELLERSDDGRVRIGARLRRLGMADDRVKDLLTLARAHVSDIARKSGQTSLFFVPGERAARCLVRAPGRDIDILMIGEGDDAPYHVGAGSKAILAAMNDETADMILSTLDFHMFTPRTISEVTALRQELDNIRKRGHAIGWEDMVPGVAAVAVPLIDSSGTVVGAFSNAGLVGHFDPDSLNRYVNILQEAANQMRESLKI